MKTFQALAILLTLRYLDNVDKPTVARTTKQLLELFEPMSEGCGYAINYDGSTNPSRKISIDFFAPPLGDRNTHFAKPDGMLHGYIDVYPNLAEGCTYRILGSGSKELNQQAHSEASRVLKLGIPTPLAGVVESLAVSGGLSI